jgi:hypothetical protein
VHVVGFGEDDTWAEASGAAPVESGPGCSCCDAATSRDVIPGATPEVIRTTSAAHTAVVLHRTSTRSRPSSHVTDEPEEVDGGMVRDPPSALERRDGICDGTEAIGHG